VEGIERVPTKAVCVGALSCAVVVFCAGRAWASLGVGGETPGSNPGISAGAGVPGGVGAGTSDASNCNWQLLNNPTNPQTPTPPEPKVIGGRPAELYVRTCGSAVNLVWVVPITGAAAAPGALAAVEKLLPKPEPTMVPPDVDAHGYAYAQVPLWWWIPASQWHPVSATATASNGPQTVSATATATPTVIEFNAGDGAGAVSCPGPGAAFDAALPLAAQSTPCQYTYRDSSSVSPSGTWQASWSIVWTVTWQASDGTGGALAPLTSTTERALAVAEDQSVVVDPNS
jgi:hypothetical protein